MRIETSVVPLIDFIRTALGKHDVKTREENVNENFQAWLVAQGVTPEQAAYLTPLKERGLAKGRVDLCDLFEPPLSIQNASERRLKLFGQAPEESSRRPERCCFLPRSCLIIHSWCANSFKDFAGCRAVLSKPIELIMKNIVD